MANVALVDDHVLLRKGLASLLTALGHVVVGQADNGLQFIDLLKSQPLPEVILLDINMPQMDGYTTALWLKENHPDVKILALSMYDDEHAILQMIKNGARGFILKDCEPEELRSAIYSIIAKGVYHSELVSNRLIHHLSKSDRAFTLGLNQRELDFLRLICSELTYKEIADQLFVSPRTIDGYRDALFEKLSVKSRTGLVLYAIKHKIISL